MVVTTPYSTLALCDVEDAMADGQAPRQDQAWLGQL